MSSITSAPNNTLVPTAKSLRALVPSRWSALAFDRFVPRFDRKERRIHVYLLSANIIPTIYVLSHLKETPWGLFTC